MGRIISKLSFMLLFGLLLESCSPLIYGDASYETDNLYGVHSKEQIQSKLQRQIEAQELQREQNKQEWAQLMGLSQVPSSDGGNGSYTGRQTSQVVGSDYDTPYGERLKALSAGEQNPGAASSVSSSSTRSATSPIEVNAVSSKATVSGTYVQLGTEAQLDALADYDPDYYKASIGLDGELIIEPRYENSTYGSWYNPVLVSPTWYFGYSSVSGIWGGVYARPYYWNYDPFYWGGYNPYFYDPFYAPFYGPYYDPFYNPFYNPYYPYYPHNRPGYRPYPPAYRPGHRPGGPHHHGGYTKPTIVNRPSGYHSSGNSSVYKTGNKRSDGSTVGSSSSSRYNRGGTNNSSSNSSYNSNNQSRGSSSSSQSFSRPSSTISRPSSSGSSSRPSHLRR